MHRSTGAILGVVVAAVGCAPEAFELAEQGEVCGEPSPFRLLELDEGEQLTYSAYATQRIGDRLYFVTGPVVDATDEPQNGFSGIAMPSTTTVYSTGLCGESPRVVAHDVWRMFEHERWPGLALGCPGMEYYEDLVLFDPLGIDAPRTVLPAPGCGLGEETEHGIVGPLEYGAEVTSLVLLPWPDAPGEDVVTPIVLIDGLPGTPSWEVSVGAKTEVFALDVDRRLISMILPDGQPVVEREHVSGFGVSRDGRFLVWRDVGEDPNGIVGTITLVDRTTGVETFIIEGRFTDWPPLGDDYLSVADAAEETLRIVHVPTLATYEVPWEGLLVGPLADERWMKLDWFYGPYHLLDLSTGATTLVTERLGHWGIGAEAMWLLEAGDGSRAQGPYWHIPYDGSGERLLARRAMSGLFSVTDGRLVTSLDVDDHFLGDLVAIDPDTLDEQLVDDHVFAFAAQHRIDWDGLDLVYGVSDGDRSGVWMARLAPRDGFRQTEVVPASDPPVDPRPRPWRRAADARPPYVRR